jgi:hypothetical protein
VVDADVNVKMMAMLKCETERGGGRRPLKQEIECGGGEILGLILMVLPGF